MEQDNDLQEVSNPEGWAEPETAEESETLTDNSEELIKAQEYAKNQKIRAEKAEQELKALKKTPEKETPKNDMSLKDIRALADVHDDDVDSVVDWAKFKGISIAEAKKSSEIQSLLRTRMEERQTAQATNVGQAKRGSSKVSDESLLEKLATSDISELSEDEMEQIAKARIEQKKKGA